MGFCLVFVHERVGARQNLFDALAGLPLDQTESGVHLHFRPLRPEVKCVPTENPFSHAFDVRLGLCQVPIKHHDELISAPAPHDVSGA